MSSLTLDTSEESQRQAQRSAADNLVGTPRKITIGSLATRFGVSCESLRNWERQGLIPPSRRTPGGHRRYSEDHVFALAELIGPPRDGLVLPRPFVDEDLDSELDVFADSRPVAAVA